MNDAGALMTFRPARGKIALAAAGSLAFVAAGVFFLTLDPPYQGRGVPAPVVGWASILLFGGCLAVAGWELLRGGRSVTVTEEGITIRRMPGGAWGPVRWREISRISVGKRNGHSFLVLEFVDADAVLARLGKRPGQFHGFSSDGVEKPVWVSSLKFDKPVEEVATSLTALWEARR